MEEMNEKEKNEAKDTSLFGPSVDSFIKSRKAGKKKRSANKSRCLVLLSMIIR